jgi:tetratricopeptide (TPR) repeat protein
VASDLSNLAALHAQRGNYPEAERLYLRALEIWKTAVGAMNPKVATCLGDLAALYTDQGEYGKAEPLLLGALDIDRKVRGPMHPDAARNLYGLARLYRAQGAHEKARPLLSRAVEIREAQLRTELARLSEARRRALMTTLRDETASVVSFHVDAMPTSAPARELALTTVLRRKGRILDSLAETQATLRNHLTPRLQGQLDRLAQARAELARLLYSSPGGTPDRAAAIAASRARVEALEAALGAASAEVRAQAAPVTIANVQAALPRGAMLVEFVRYQPFVRERRQQRSSSS